MFGGKGLVVTGHAHLGGVILTQLFIGKIGQQRMLLIAPIFNGFDQRQRAQRLSLVTHQVFLTLRNVCQRGDGK